MTGRPPHRVAVFGATSPTGWAFLEAANAEGWHTSALVRDADRLAGIYVDSVLTGSVFDPTDVETAIGVADTVLIALGLKGDRRTPLYSSGTATIVEAMKARGARRLLVLSEAAYGQHSVGLVSGVVRRGYAAVAGPILAERRRQDGIVEASGLDWTTVRIKILSDGHGTDKAIPHHVPQGLIVARTLRTAFVTMLLDLVDDRSAFGRNVYP
jgi:hypothetical protein